MRILLSTLALCIACTASAQGRDDAAAQADAGLARELAGLTPERPQGCIPQTQLRSTSVKAYGDTLVYRTSGSLRYVTRTSGGCGRVGEDAILITRTPSTSLCRGDIATSVDRYNRFPVGSCSFGEFTPYRRAR
jgi:hypothetical protein